MALPKRPKSVIVHHSTWLGIDPHDLNGDSSIHAGSMQAAYDRLGDGLDVTIKNSDYTEGEPMTSYLHSYEIPTSLIKSTMHMDPDHTSRNVLRHSNTSRKRMPIAPQSLSPYEDESENRVIPYVNSFEDKGSTSYVIPSRLVHEGRIKHLGSQFITRHELTNDGTGEFEAPKAGFNANGGKLNTFER